MTSVPLLEWAPLSVAASRCHSEGATASRSEASVIMNCRTIGLDLTRQVFQIHGIDEQGKVVLRKQAPHQQLAAFFANLPPCLVGMEACCSAHFWARKLIALGHVVKLMASQFVKLYVKGSKCRRC